MIEDEKRKKRTVNISKLKPYYDRLPELERVSLDAARILDAAEKAIPTLRTPDKITNSKCHRCGKAHALMGKNPDTKKPLCNPCYQLILIQRKKALRNTTSSVQHPNPQPEINNPPRSNKRKIANTHDKSSSAYTTGNHKSVTKQRSSDRVLRSRRS